MRDDTTKQPTEAQAMAPSCQRPRRPALASSTTWRHRRLWPQAARSSLPRPAEPRLAELAPAAALAPAAGRARAFPSGSGLRRGGCAERDQSAARVRGSSTVPRHAAMPRSQRRATVPSTGAAAAIPHPAAPWKTAPPSVNARAGSAPASSPAQWKISAQHASTFCASSLPATVGYLIHHADR